MAINSNNSWIHVVFLVTMKTECIHLSNLLPQAAILACTLAGRLTFNSQDLISNSTYCLPYSFRDVSLENLVLNQLIIP